MSIDKKVYGSRNSRVIVVFGDLNTKQYQLWFLGQLLASYKFKAIVYTLTDSLLSLDPEQIATSFTHLKYHALQTIRSLPKKEQKNLAVFGIGLGTVPAFMVANEASQVSKIIANISGANLAEIVWEWKSNNTFKKQLYRKKINQQKLQEIWFDLSPSRNLEGLPQKEVLLYMASHDEIFSFTQQEQLLNDLKKAEVSSETIINTRHNHRVSTLINLLHFNVYLSFLRR